jgi:hypothetical protein
MGASRNVRRGASRVVEGVPALRAAATRRATGRTYITERLSKERADAHVNANPPPLVANVSIESRHFLSLDIFRFRRSIKALLRGIRELTLNATCLRRLMRRSALRPPASAPLTERHLLVTPRIADLLDGKHIGTGFPDVMADLVNARYLAGHLIRISLTYRKGAKPDLERLDGLIDDVWALCYRTPRPGWRPLGRFIEPGTFIALRAYDRHQLGGTRRYSAAAYDTIEDWDTLFRSTGADPIRGARRDDYLTGVSIDA